MLLPAAASAQSRVITGAITVAGSAEPLPGATVIIVGTAAAARAGADGRYRLVAPDGNVNLLVRAIGYKRVTRPLPAGQTSADFALEKDPLHEPTLQVLFFASPLSDWITGQILSVSGGYTMV